MKAAMVVLASAALMCAPAPARATDYPSKPITLMIGFAPGGPSDVMARILTKKMEEMLKQPLVIENRAGAGGSIAGAAVARAAPDGYTVLLATGSLLAINVSLYKNIGYDPEKDFEPIGMIGTQTNVLYLNPSVPATSLAELIAYAKANPGKLSFGSGGNGTPAHLAGELLKLEAKIDITHVPFRGTGPALQAVIGGHVPMAFNPPSPLLPHIQSGTIRPLAVTTLKRTQVLPEVPTIAKWGFPLASRQALGALMPMDIGLVDNRPRLRHHRNSKMATATVSPGAPPRVRTGQWARWTSGAILLSSE